MGINKAVGERFLRWAKIKRNIVGIIALVVGTAVVLLACGQTMKSSTLQYNHAMHSKLQGEERMKVADQIIQVDQKVKKTYYPDPDSVFVAPTGSLKTVGLLMFDAGVMNTGGKTPGCCVNIYPLEAVQQVISERMLASWNKALAKHATSGITLVPFDKIAQSASYQKLGNPVKDWPNNRDTSVFQKLDKALLGLEAERFNYSLVVGGGKAPTTGIAYPRGTRKFSWAGGEGAAAFKFGHGAPIKEIGAENGLDAAILVMTTYDWKTDYPQMVSANMKGTATITMTASVNVPNGRWEEAVKAMKQKTYGVAMSPAFRVYSVAFEDKVIVPWDNAASNPIAVCCRKGIGAEADRDMHTPMLEEYDQVVDMLVEKMIADLRTTQIASAK